MPVLVCLKQVEGDQQQEYCSGNPGQVSLFKILKEEARLQRDDTVKINEGPLAERRRTVWPAPPAAGDIDKETPEHQQVNPRTHVLREKYSGQSKSNEGSIQYPTFTKTEKYLHHVWFVEIVRFPVIGLEENFSGLHIPIIRDPGHQQDRYEQPGQSDGRKQVTANQGNDGVPAESQERQKQYDDSVLRPDGNDASHQHEDKGQVNSFSPGFFIK